MKPEGFPQWLRLRRRADFLRVQRAGEKHHMRHFLVFIAPRRDLGVASGAGEVTPLPRPAALKDTRLGVTVTRKVGPAVVRNRIKRLVREAFRRNRTRFVPGLDMVWVAKRGAAGVEYPDVVGDMETLARRLAGRRASRPGAASPTGGAAS